MTPSGGTDKTCRLQRRARVTETRELCPTGTVLLSFRVVDDEPFDFEPGQFVAVDFLHPRLGYRRSPYCICTPPAGRRTFDLLVRVIPSGPVSLFLGELEPGDLISFRGPSGRGMPPRAGGLDLVLLATGVGVSPLLSLVASLLSLGDRRSISLYWGLRLEEDICFTSLLEGWSDTFSSFTYEISLSQPPDGWTGLRGRLTETVPPLLDSLDDKLFYLSGNGAMIAEMSGALALAGVPRSRIFEEYFFNLRHKPSWDALLRIRERFATPHDPGAPWDAISRLPALGRRG